VATRRILLVDDEADIRAVAIAALERLAGWSVVSASSGPEAIALARVEAVEAIVLDVMMPGMDGPTTLAHLQADEHTRDIPVVFLTAKVQQGEQEGLRALGASGVVAKPFDPLTLAEALSNELGWT
jgi:two-component system alkaline phosphatase synthesis response regulator PhoP